MAELDSFFAKKDKKKKGKGKKYTGTSPAVMAKALEVTEAPPPPEPEKKEFQIELPSSKSADDEWHEVEEKGQDLEGLKIRSLKLDETEENTDKWGAEERTDEDEDTTADVTETSTSSAWRSVTSQPETSETEVVEEEEVPETTPPAPPTSNRYIPPSLRNQPVGGRGPAGPYRPPTGGAYRPPGRRGKAPPDIQNTEAFPSLKTTGKE